MKFSWKILGGCLLPWALSCGAPTPYQQYLHSKKSECEAECEKAHSEKDKNGRKTCIRVCEAQKDLENQK